MVLERADRRHQHHGGGVEPRLPTLDVEELLGTEVEGEPRLGDRPIGDMQRHPGRQHAVAAMRDVGERSAMDERRHPFDRLDQIRFQGVGEQRHHRARDPQVARGDRLAVVGETDQRPVDARAQVLAVRGQAEDRHHFRRRGDVEAGLARHALLVAAEADHRVAQRPVVHVEAAPPEDAPRIDAELVAEVEVVVDHRREQVVGGRDGVEVAGEVQVDPLGRLDRDAPPPIAPPLTPRQGPSEGSRSASAAE